LRFLFDSRSFDPKSGKYKTISEECSREVVLKLIQMTGVEKLLIKEDKEYVWKIATDDFNAASSLTTEIN